jgi:hypothetical protein
MVARADLAQDQEARASAGLAGPWDAWARS